MKRTVVCYKTKQPIIYNKGTQYEVKEDRFLSYYTHKTAEEAKAECDKLNTEHPETLWNGKPIDWTEVDFFFVSEQEEMI